jgi:poly(A) polymerase
VIQKLFNILFRRNKKNAANATNATVIPRAVHNVSRKKISSPALKVLYRLHEAGFAAYLVGGGVRDLLLHRSPKDFDVATDAKPEQIKKLFRNCLLIGRRFRIAHVRFGQDIIEVTTFRSNSTQKDEHRAHSKLGMLLRDNVYGTIEEDALRRDFTVNALYYNIADFSIVDFTNGMQDLQDKTLRLIGKPATRYQEDPVRLLRAIRFAAKLNFTLHPDTEAPIQKSAPLLMHVAPARLFDEFLKLFFHGQAHNTFLLLEQYDLLKYLLPIEKDTLPSPVRTLIMQGLMKTDERVQLEQSVNPAFLLAVCLWHLYVEKFEALKESRLAAHLASQKALAFVLNSNELPMAIPRRLTEIIRDIWLLQWRLTSMTRQNAVHIALHPRHRAAYDFLLLRTSIEPSLIDAANWWTEYFGASHEQQQALLEQLPAPRKKPNRYKRKKPHAKNNIVHSAGE